MLHLQICFFLFLLIRKKVCCTGNFFFFCLLDLLILIPFQSLPSQFSITLLILLLLFIRIINQTFASSSSEIYILGIFTSRSCIDGKEMYKSCYACVRLLHGNQRSSYILTQRNHGIIRETQFLLWQKTNTRKLFMMPGPYSNDLRWHTICPVAL